MKKMKKILSVPLIWISIISIITLLVYSMRLWDFSNNALCHISIIISAILIIIGIFSNPLKDKLKNLAMKDDDIK